MLHEVVAQLELSRVVCRSFHMFPKPLAEITAILTITHVNMIVDTIIHLINHTASPTRSPTINSIQLSLFSMAALLQLVDMEGLDHSTLTKLVPQDLRVMQVLHNSLFREWFQVSL
jgi:hypothetical protein